jgi:hypothetical protein
MLLVSFWVALILAACPVRNVLAHGGRDAVPVNIGVNVGGVNDYAVESFFVDAMKQSRHWGSPQTPWDEAAQVDKRGWPTQDAGVVVLCCLADRAGNSELPGTYSLQFTGIANVALVVYGGTVANMVYNAATNTSTADVTLADSGSGTSLMLAFTNTQRTQNSPVGSGVTDVTLMRPQIAPNGKAWWTTATQVFTNPFLALLQPFSTLRFMDFTATNSENVHEWRQRTTPQMATQQSPNGAAWEYAILLANTLHKDVWINIPDQADSKYWAQLATLFKNTLDPSLHIWLEYSNEVWNYSFPQARRNQLAAQRIVRADRASPLALHCHQIRKCRYVWAERLIGLRALQIGQAFAAAYGGNASTVLRPVFATQVGQTYFVSLVMSMITQAFGPPSQYLYAIAQAPYWSGDNSIDGLSAPQELANAAADIPTLAQPEHDFAVWATNYGLHSVTYEGGPGMSGTASLQAKIEANRAPEIGDLVANSIRGAISSDVSLYMYYNDAGGYGQYGMWGLTEDVFDPATPKLAGVAAVLADGHEKLAVGNLLPASIVAATPDLCTGGNYVGGNGAYIYLKPGGACGYLVNAPAAGMYNVVLSVGNYYTATTAELRLDDRAKGQIAIPDTGGNIEGWTNTTPASVKLSAGLHVLSIKSTGAEGFSMQTVSVGAP